MLDHFFRRPRVRDRLRANPLGPRIEAYVAYLDARGHPRGTIQPYVHAVEHFGTWLTSEHLAIEDVSQATVDSFLHRHLPLCRCPTQAPTHLYQVRAALAHLLRVPGGHPPRSQPTPALDPVDEFLGRYRGHPQDTCGLAESTRTCRLRYAREFLRGKFGDGPMRWGEVRPEDLMAWIVGYAARCRPRSAQVAASSLRSLLRFVQLRGDGGPALVAAVPQIPGGWRDHLPRTMSDEQLRQFLAGFDWSIPTGRRDYAMALCQVDLGLLRQDSVIWGDRPIPHPLPRHQDAYPKSHPQAGLPHPQL